ncbi:hypothetical protein ECG_09442 [Echinococcus granulosus]|nr:hypothetical protein ECG_09442 [Echinococcus granulosus]
MKTALIFVTLSLDLFTVLCSAKPELLSDKMPPLAACAVLVLAFSILLLICFIHYFLMPSTRHAHIHVMHFIERGFTFGAAPSAKCRKFRQSAHVELGEERPTNRQ